MMMEFGACPQCKLDISPERKAIKPLVCEHCGYTSTNDEKVKSEIEKRTFNISRPFRCSLLPATSN